MDKNIAAILRSDTRTIKVIFNNDVHTDGKEYTYVTDTEVQAGDRVLVFTAPGALKVCLVTKVDDDLEIAPNSDIKYKWIVAKVDMAAYEANEARNKAIEKAIGDAYRKSTRTSYARQILGEASAEEQVVLLQLIGNTKAEV